MSSKQYIILKADDLSNSYRYKKYLKLIESKRIKTSVGVIGRKFPSFSFFNVYLKKLLRNGTIELWNYGYNNELHKINELGKEYSEFYNTNYDYQEKHLLRTQKLIEKRLGLVL